MELKISENSQETSNHDFKNKSLSSLISFFFLMIYSAVIFNDDLGSVSDQYGKM